jgi:D-arabinose 1-dehydrogenase-like Zn-dependent alcohol dehydrogenase
MPAMPAQMKASVVHAFGQALRLEEVPIPAQILVKAMASGVCHADLHAANGDWSVRPTLNGGYAEYVLADPGCASEGKVRTAFSEARLDDVDAIFARTRAGDLEGRVVMRIGDGA